MAIGCARRAEPIGIVGLRGDDRPTRAAQQLAQGAKRQTPHAALRRSIQRSGDREIGMATRTQVRGHSWDWLRVGAWSGSVAAHVAALLLIALPVTAPLMMRTAQAPIEARWIETPPPPPAIPEPPPPVAPRHVRPPIRTPLPPSTPVSHEDAPMQTPIAADTPIASVAVDSSPDTTPTASDIGFGGATQNLAYASPIRPRYPPESARAREEGTVLLRVLVDEAGAPQQVDIARSSGHARLDNAAREAVSRARFRPVLRNGVAIPVWGTVPIAFRLDRG
jgi:protein TonB